MITRIIVPPGTRARRRLRQFSGAVPAAEAQIRVEGSRWRDAMRELNATQGPNGPGDAGLILAAQYVPVATSDTRLSRLHHVGLGRAHAGKEVPVHIAAAHVRVVEADGSLLRELVLDADRDYQPRLHSSPMS